jgi:ribonuclease Z
MNRKWLGVAILFLLIAVGVAWTQADAIRLRVFIAAATKALARDPLAALDPKALHVGFCGTGSPLPNRERGEACTVVIAGGRLFVFDAGEAAARTLGSMAMPLGKVEGVWLTHLHSDHFNGLGNLALQRWAGTSATTPLAVAGPEGVAEVTEALTRAYRIDSTYRIAHHGEAVVPPSGFALTGTAIAPGLVHDRDGVRITAFAVPHDPVKPAFGYRLDWNGLSVTISGDTARADAIARAAKGTDLLVHEVLSPRMVKVLEQAARAAGQPNRARIMADIPGYHASAADAADTAKSAGAKALAFSHLVPSVPNALMPAVVADATGRFDGPMFTMADGDVLSITAQGITRQNILR